nr:CHAP domain-containing protein [Dorea sp. AGR2135]
MLRQRQYILFCTALQEVSELSLRLSGKSLWDSDGTTDHVGLVERVENGRVYTVEGNSGDMVRQSSYSIGDISIYGYGVPNY